MKRWNASSHIITILKVVSDRSQTVPGSLETSLANQQVQTNLNEVPIFLDTQQLLRECESKGECSVASLPFQSAPNALGASFATFHIWLLQNHMVGVACDRETKIVRQGRWEKFRRGYEGNMCNTSANTGLALFWRQWLFLSGQLSTTWSQHNLKILKGWNMIQLKSNCPLLTLHPHCLQNIVIL